MKIRPLFLSALAAVSFATAAHARFMSPRAMPVERLLKNAETYLAAHPASAEAHYLVARIRYLAFAQGGTTIPATSEADADGKPVIPADGMLAMFGNGPASARRDEAQRLALQDVGGTAATGVPEGKQAAFDAALAKRLDELNRTGWRPAGGLSDQELAAHAAGALAEFRAALKLESKNALYVLGLASLTEQVADWTVAKKPAGLTAELAALDHAGARASYLEAFRLGYATESSLGRQPLTGLPGLVSHEAGNAFVRLVGREAKPAADITTALAEVQAGLKKLSAIPRGAMTPIVFALRPVADVDELLAPETMVDFDLRGYGPTERWPWVRPDTALLVWDPTRSGEITSGQQLFGGYTFQLFRANGYDALAALDDNGDGVLAGDELAGIRAWFDHNSDGVSAPAEVRDLDELGIVALAVRATGQDGPHPKNEAGLITSDGRRLPTWDWMAEPARR
jgi:hypothetical protein